MGGTPAPSAQITATTTCGRLWQMYQGDLAAAKNDNHWKAQQDLDMQAATVSKNGYDAEGCNNGGGGVVAAGPKLIDQVRTNLANMMAQQAEQKMNALEGVAQSNPNVAAADGQFNSAAQNANQVADNMQNASGQDSQAILASLGGPASGLSGAHSPSGYTEASSLGGGGNNARAGNGADLAASSNTDTGRGSSDPGAAASDVTAPGGNNTAGQPDLSASSTHVASLAANPSASADGGGDAGTQSKNPYAAFLGSPSDAKGRAPIRRADCPLDDIVQGIDGAMPSYCVLNIGKTYYIGEWHFLSD